MTFSYLLNSTNSIPLPELESEGMVQIPPPMDLQYILCFDVELLSKMAAFVGKRVYVHSMTA